MEYTFSSKQDIQIYKPILGYLHKGMEKIAENWAIIQYLPYVTHWDYLATMFIEAITANGLVIVLAKKKKKN